MSNELLLILNLVLIYGCVLLWYALFDVAGLYCWTVLATVAANIEVMILIRAFGVEQTLGNILFASTFLVTDILSEVAGKEEANKAVNVGILTSVCFILIAQGWLFYTPAENDFVFSSVKTLFSNTPRIMCASLIVYAIVQKFDVWIYHKWWEFTSRKYKDTHRFLWLRNNGSTLISQLLNSVLFTFAAFYGIYDLPTIGNIIVVSYVIFIVTSLADTPVVYLARYIKERYKK